MWKCMYNSVHHASPKMPSLQWRHNERDGISNHQRIHCLLNCWFRRRSKKTSKLRVTGLCAGNSPVTMWWRHHGLTFYLRHLQYMSAHPLFGQVKPFSSSIAATSNHRHDVWNYQPIEWQQVILTDSKETSKMRVAVSLWVGSPTTGGFPAQRDSNTETVSI